MLRGTNLFAPQIFRHSYTTNTIRMSTFNLAGADVSIKLVDDLTKDELLKFPAFKVPLSHMLHSLILNIT
jgi:hypothetical protein